MNRSFAAQFSSDHQLVAQRDLIPPQATDPSKIVVSVEGVIKLLRTLKNGKSPGPDDIRKEDLVIALAIVAKCLSYIFNVSLASSRLPEDWKLAHVTPLHKKGPTDQPNNYRPISLTSIPCKLLEHIVLHHLNIALDPVLYNRQHGFRKGLSCETQLCGTFHDIARNAEKRCTTHAVVMDFSKAFDKVSHQLLMNKLSNIPNINCQILDWVHNFLLNRRQKVVVSGQTSTESLVTSGVPQGSVLRPTLFLAYISDLPEHVNCNISLFADDTLLYQTVNDIADKQSFQADINALQTWANIWGMSFNASKCSTLVFNDHGESPDARYTLGGTSLEIVSEIKYLGVVLQSDMKFNTHITNKINIANRQLGLIKRALFNAPESAKLLAYTSLCRPHVEYASSVWDPHLDYSNHDIEKVQNKAIRFICNLKGRDIITETRKKLDLETFVESRRQL